MITPVIRHCETRSDEAIQKATEKSLDCFVASRLAMTDVQLGTGVDRVTSSTDKDDDTSRPTELQIRLGMPADIPALRSIECAVFDLEQLTARAFRRYISLPGADLVVAVRGGELIGYGITSYRRNSLHGRLISIAAATNATGRGVGMAVLVGLHDLARTRAMRTIRLEVRSDNLAALGLYQRAGYAIIGRKPAYYADFCDAIVMEHRLSQ